MVRKIGHTIPGLSMDAESFISAGNTFCQLSIPPTCQWSPFWFFSACSATSVGVGWRWFDVPHDTAPGTCPPSLELFLQSYTDMGMDQYLLIPFLGG